MRKPAAQLPRVCPGSGVQIPLTWEEAEDRTIERACTACGELVSMHVIVGGSAAKKLDSVAAAKIPQHARRKEGRPP